MKKDAQILLRMTKELKDYCSNQASRLGISTTAYIIMILSKEKTKSE